MAKRKQQQRRASTAAHKAQAEREKWKAGGKKGPEPAGVVWVGGVSYRTDADDIPADK